MVGGSRLPCGVSQNAFALPAHGMLPESSVQAGLIKHSGGNGAGPARFTKHLGNPPGSTVTSVPFYQTPPNHLGGRKASGSRKLAKRSLGGGKRERQSMATRLVFSPYAH